MQTWVRLLGKAQRDATGPKFPLVNGKFSSSGNQNRLFAVATVFPSVPISVHLNSEKQKNGTQSLQQRVRWGVRGSLHMLIPGPLFAAKEAALGQGRVQKQATLMPIGC